MRINRHITFLLLNILLGAACEKPIDINLPPPANAVVVEGHIENGVPPYVLLTKNSAFFGGLNLNDIESYFVHGAEVWVKSGNDSVQLVEYTPEFLSTLPDSVVQALAIQLGIDVSSLDELPPISVYTIPFNNIYLGEIGRSYDLRIEVDGKTITSTTTIPLPQPFDSLWLEAHPDAALADSFFQLYAFLNDPPSPGNYYRYFTRVDNEAWLVANSSVFDDGFFNGKRFKIFIPKGHPVGQNFEDFDNTTGYWNVADSTLYVRLCMIDKPHYDFWRTLENERNSQGNPFGSFTYVKSNIKGGIGVWGGYGSITQSYKVFE